MRMVRAVFDNLNEPWQKLSPGKLRFVWPAVLAILKFALRTMPENDPRRASIRELIDRITSVTPSMATPVPAGMGAVLGFTDQQVAMVGLLGDTPVPASDPPVGEARIYPVFNMMYEHPTWPGHEVFMS